MRNQRIRIIIARILIVSLCLTCKGTFYFADNSSVFADILPDEQILQEVSGTSLDKMLGWNGGSKTNGENSIITSELAMSSINYTGKDDKSIFYYTDDYFKNDSTVYNNHLSTMSIELAIAGVGSYHEDERDKYANAKDVLSKIGFDNITPNYDYLHKPEEDTMGAVCANKHIYLKGESGDVNEYNLMAVVMRSANYELEWDSNFKIGASGDHQGFSESRDLVYNHFNTFYNEHKDDYGTTLPVKIWIVGYSRGAAVANMLGAKVTDNQATFNTTKENIYCYTLGTPKGVLKSEHTTPLDSYNNIHNVVTYSDAFQLVAMETLGFGRYGVDHVLPHYASDKVHDPVKRAEIQSQNAIYLQKYDKMMENLKKIDPSIVEDLTDFKMYKLVLFDASTLSYMIYSRLGDEPFVETSPEKEYLQAFEFANIAIDQIIGDELLNCAYPGTDYAEITGRQRYFEKYQDIIAFLVNLYAGGSGRMQSVMEKLQENFNNNPLLLFSLVLVLNSLVYCEGEPQARNHYIPGYDPSRTYEESSYISAYDQMKEVYEKIFAGAFTTDEYNFLIDRNKDITDFLLDLLNIDYRTSKLPSQSLIGTISQNVNILVSMHIGAYYLSWLQSEDEYFDTPPADVIKYDGIKTVTFTDLSDSKIEIYDMSDNKICEYVIDTSNNITYNELIENNYTDIVKSYNPDGLELRLPSNVNCKAILTANKSLGNAVYREFFADDATFYRKEKQLGTIQLTNNEYYEMIFSESSISKVFSCYLYSDLDDHKSKTFAKVDVNGVEKGSGYDAYTFASEEQFSKKSNLLGLAKENITNLLASRSELVAVVASLSETHKKIDDNENVETIETATIESETTEVKTSELETSEIESVIESETEIVIESETESEIESETESVIESETENEIESETESVIESETETVAESETEIESEEETVSAFTGTFGDGIEEKYKVTFTTMADGEFYYDSGSGFVKGRSGDSYSPGTKIKFTAPFTYDSRPFYGWTLTDDTGKYINTKGIDTPKIYDESTSAYSTYVLELKNYDINILANYQFKEYKLKLSVDYAKGTIKPDGTAIEYNSVDDFNAVKSNITIQNVGENIFLNWSDGIANYLSLSDYNWQYKNNVTLKAVFNTDTPKRRESNGSNDNKRENYSGNLPIPENRIKNEDGNLKIVEGAWIYHPYINKWEYYVHGSDGTIIKLKNGTFAIKDERNNFVLYSFDENGFLR